MNAFFWILDWIGMIGTAATVVLAIVAAIYWIRGIGPALWRLGNGLARRKIVIFASAAQYSSLEKLLVDSGLFSRRNIFSIPTSADVASADGKTIFLVYWPDFGSSIDAILSRKIDSCAMVVYSPTDHDPIPREQMVRLGNHRNTTVTNFRGRLLNDVVTAMITTGYAKS